MNNRGLKKFSKQNYSDTIAQIRGELALEKVTEVLAGFKKLRIIRDFGRTDAFSEEDLDGVDIIIYPHQSWGGKILLQIQSSFSLKQKRKYNKKGILYLAVPPKMDLYEVEEMFSGILARMLIKKMEEKRLITI